MQILLKIINISVRLLWDDDVKCVVFQTNCNAVVGVEVDDGCDDGLKAIVNRKCLLSV